MVNQVTLSGQSLWWLPSLARLPTMLVCLALAAWLSGCQRADTPADTNSQDNASTVQTTPANTQAASATKSSASVAIAEPAENTATSPVTANASNEGVVQMVNEPDVNAPENNAPDAAIDGSAIYDAHCKVCHDAGLLASPKLGDAAAWQARLAQGKETLYAHSINGFKKMPAQAVNGVSEAQVRAAVDYMAQMVETATPKP